jgi:hypothetical protein
LGQLYLCQLDETLWFTLESLPNIPVFAEMLTLVDSLRMIDDETIECKAELTR